MKVSLGLWTLNRSVVGDLAADLRSFRNLGESRDTVERLRHLTVSRKSWRRS